MLSSCILRATFFSDVCSLCVFIVFIRHSVSLFFSYSLFLHLSHHLTVEHKREAAAAKARVAAERAAAAEAKEAARREKAKIKPQDMFRDKTDLYSQFDEQVCGVTWCGVVGSAMLCCWCFVCCSVVYLLLQGIPTHDASGKELSKNALKKLKKEWEDQKSLYESFASAAGKS
mgnify:CR=1 FL=1